MTTPRLDSEGLFPWRYLVRALNAGFSLRCLTLAAAGVSLAALGTELVTPGHVTPGHVAPGHDAALPEASLVARAFTGPLTIWANAAAPLVRQASGRTESPWVDAVLATLWSLVVWGICGAGISRAVACRLAYVDPPAGRLAARQALASWHSRVAPPVALLLLAVALLAPLWLHSIMMRVGVLNVVSAVVLPLALLSALAAAVLAVCVAVAWPLMIVGPSIDKADAFDNAGASLAYATQRLPQLAAYLVTALLVAAPVGVLAETVAVVLGQFTQVMPRAALAAPEYSRAAHAIAEFWSSNLVRLAPKVFYAAYFWAAATAIYMLLRRDVDGRMVDSVAQESPERTP